MVTPSCSFSTPWRSGMLGACVVRLWSHVVASMFCELLCLSGCVSRCCFRIVFDSAGSVGVVFGPTLVVGHGVTLFRCFVVLCSRLTPLLSSGRDSLSQEFIARRWWWRFVAPRVANSVSCKHERLYRELRVAFLQVLGVASFPAGSGCELQESVATIAGCACYEHGCWFAHTAIEFVVSLRVRVGVSRRLREPTCGVAFTVGVFARAKQMLVCHVAPLVEHYDTCLWLLSALGWLVVNSGEVLLEFFSVGSGGIGCYCVALEVEEHRLVALCSGDGFRELLVVVLSGALVVLVEALLGPACITSTVLLAAVFLSDDPCLCRLVGLRSGEVLPERLLALLVELYCGTLCVPMVKRFASFLAPCVLCQMIVWSLMERVLPVSHVVSASGATPWYTVFYIGWLLVLVLAPCSPIDGTPGSGRGLWPDVFPGFASAHCACGAFGLVFLWLHSRCVSLSDQEDDLVCHVGECVTPSFCGSAYIVCPGRTTRMIWVLTVARCAEPFSGVLQLTSRCFPRFAISSGVLCLVAVFLAGLVRAVSVELSTSNCELCAIWGALCELSDVCRGVQSRRVKVGNVTPRPVAFWGLKVKSLGRCPFFLSLLFPSLLFSEGERWFPLPSLGVEHGGAGGGSCGAWSGVVERGGGVLAVEKALWGSCRPASPSHCLALRWFRSCVGRVGMGLQLGRATVVAVPVVRHSFSLGRSVSLVVTLGCSFSTPWRSGMLGACVVRLRPRVVAPVFCELLCLGGFMPRCCFRIVFDFASSAGVVFGPALVVGHGVTLFRCFVVLYSRCFSLYCFLE
ncbi:hypothetical protein Taro_016199 [Colocasia esculenta]|uniref:Uncharacterized protein n=1 Tax=Colocasia esculenta TaxID=4460 RepID=A0A843UPG6_COLES|nr:hypothetical protein [Colocasia esculenta]